MIHGNRIVKDEHPGQKEKMEKLWKLMALCLHRHMLHCLLIPICVLYCSACKETYEPNDPESIQKSFARHLEYSLACTRFNFTMQDCSV